MTGDGSSVVEQLGALSGARKPRHRRVRIGVITHDIAVGRACDRIVRMLDGRVVDDLVPEVPRVRTHDAA